MSNKQPEFLVKGYHYTEHIEGSDSQKLCIDSIEDSDFSISIINPDVDVNNYKLSFPSFYNEKNALKQNGIIEFVTKQMIHENFGTNWSFNLPYTFKKDSLIHIQRYSGESIETSNKLSNYFTNYFNNFDFVHNSSSNKAIFNTDINKNNIFIQYNSSTPQDSVPTIIYENVTDFILKIALTIKINLEILKVFDSSHIKTMKF